jgi:hypothetical protein
MIVSAWNGSANGILPERPSSSGWPKVLVPVIAEIVEEIVVAALRPLVQRIRELESNGLKYAGTYQPDQTYTRGTMVTHDGSMWCAVRDVIPGERPGDNDAFRLCVKRGKDAR